MSTNSFFFKFADSIIETNAQLTDFEPLEVPSAEFIFRVKAEQLEDLQVDSWEHHWRSADEAVSLSLGRMNGSHVLRFPEAADFVITADGRTIDCYPKPDTPTETLQHLFLNQVFPRVLSHIGKLVLHGSVVTNGETAVAFLGATGSGKSTLAASFLKRGFEILADDCLLLKQFDSKVVAVDTFNGVRLWSDSVRGVIGEGVQAPKVAHYTQKKKLLPRIETGSKNRRAIPVEFFFFLDPVDTSSPAIGVSVISVPRSQAMIELVRHAFLLDLSDRGRLARQFSELGELVEGIQFGRLRFERSYSVLEQVVDLVNERLEFKEEGD
jgi:hypothetical protein